MPIPVAAAAMAARPRGPSFCHTADAIDDVESRTVALPSNKKKKITKSPDACNATVVNILSSHVNVYILYNRFSRSDFI